MVKMSAFFVFFGLTADAVAGKGLVTTAGGRGRGVVARNEGVRFGVGGRKGISESIFEVGTICDFPSPPLAIPGVLVRCCCRAGFSATFSLLGDWTEDTPTAFKGVEPGTGDIAATGDTPDICASIMSWRGAGAGEGGEEKSINKKLHIQTTNKQITTLTLKLLLSIKETINSLQSHVYTRYIFMLDVRTK